MKKFFKTKYFIFGITIGIILFFINELLLQIFFIEILFLIIIIRYLIQKIK